MTTDRTSPNAETQAHLSGEGKEFDGVVVSDRMDKTVVVNVVRVVKHPQYKKYISANKRYKAHDEDNQCRVGDHVTIRESRPIATDKHFTVVNMPRAADRADEASRDSTEDNV